jgi:hypothetical protein
MITAPLFCRRNPQRPDAIGATEDLMSGLRRAWRARPRRHPAEEGEGVDVAIDPGLGRRRRIGADKAGIAVRQVHDEEMGLLLHPADDDRRLAEVRLCMPGRMLQRHEHLPPPAFALPHIVLHDRVAAGEAVLIVKPVEYPLGRVPLLVAGPAILLQPAVDDPGEPVQLRPLYRGGAPVSGGRRERQHEPRRVSRRLQHLRDWSLWRRGRR